MKTRIVIAILLLTQPACVKKKHKSDPIIEPGTSSDVEVFRKSLQGVWEECQEKEGSSRLVLLSFDGETLRLDTEEFLGKGCQGEQGELPRETFAMTYAVGYGQGNSGPYAFDYAVMDSAGNPSRTVHTTAKFAGDSVLQLSLGALNGDPSYGDGKSISTRYRFPDEADNQKTRTFKRLSIWF